jgi:hypothetical protein
MPSASSLILYFILILVIATLAMYLLLGSLSGGLSFVSTRLGVAGDTLYSLASSALSSANSIAGQVLDFANIIVTDINLVLQAAASAFNQIISTLGIAVVDLINFISFFVQGQNASLVSSLNALFNGLLEPIVDTITNIINTVTTIAVALIGTFNPLNC